MNRAIVAVIVIQENPGRIGQLFPLLPGFLSPNLDEEQGFLYVLDPLLQ